MTKSIDRAGLSWTGALSVVAVVAVLVLVSLPRLHAFAVEENQTDASALTRHLVSALEQAADPHTPLVELVAGLGMAANTDDLEWLEGGRILRRHGYLFELDRPRAGGAPTLRAWPWAYGETGRVAFLGRAGEPVRRHANAGGGWSGPTAPPGDDATGWDVLERPELASW
jgi:hypothetical protein